jgi:hypothetical protein
MERGRQKQADNRQPSSANAPAQSVAAPRSPIERAQVSAAPAIEFKDDLTEQIRRNAEKAAQAASAKAAQAEQSSAAQAPSASESTASASESSALRVSGSSKRAVSAHFEDNDADAQAPPKQYQATAPTHVEHCSAAPADEPSIGYKPGGY